jgi:hypothetical protein
MTRAFLLGLGFDLTPVTMGAEHVSMSVPEVGALLRGDYERWGRIIKDAGIKAD